MSHIIAEGEKQPDRGHRKDGEDPHRLTLTIIRMLPLVALGMLVALGTAVPGAQVPASPMTEGTNVLLGRVVEVTSGAPVSGAIVTLIGNFDAAGRPATPGLGVVGGSGNVPPSLNVMTTPDGYFVVRNLPPGRFTVATRALGYVNDDFPPTFIEIQDGQRATEVRLRVWAYASLSGRVADERGEPLTGMPVSALQRVWSGGGLVLRRAATTVTDDRGEYRLSQLAPGDYLVGVRSMPTTLPEGVAAALDPSIDNREASRAMVVELIQSGFGRTYGCETCISSGHEGYHLGGFVLQRPGAPLPPAPDGRPLGFANTYHPGTSRSQNATVITLGSGESRTGLDFPVRLTPAVAVTGVLAGPDGPMAHIALSLVPPGVASEFEPPVATPSPAASASSPFSASRQGSTPCAVRWST
jgi:hypothetical protein